MFTGLIEEIGAIQSVQRFGQGRRVTISAKRILHDIAIGDSIAINGVCLTVTAFNASGFTVEAVEETMLKTTLGKLHTGNLVNLESALRAGGKLGGHYVQGHVDTTSRVRSIERREESWYIGIALPSTFFRNVIPVGSIAIDGVSLTVAAKSTDSLHVSVIPHTYEACTIKEYRIGTEVNLEFDLIGKYVLESMKGPDGGSGVTKSYLESLGY